MYFVLETTYYRQGAIVRKLRRLILLARRFWRVVKDLLELVRTDSIVSHVRERKNRMRRSGDLLFIGYEDMSYREGDGVTI